MSLRLKTSRVSLVFVFNASIKAIASAALKVLPMKMPLKCTHLCHFVGDENC